MVKNKKDKEEDEGKAIAAVIQPLIDAMAPKSIKEPKTRIGKLVRKMIREHLGTAMYISILDRFIIDSAEKDPEGTFDKLRKLNVALSNIIYEMEKEEEEKTDETLQKT